VRAKLRTATLRNSIGASAIALAVAVIVGLGASWLIAGRMLRPLRTLTATTRRISHDRLNERIALNRPHDELKELADTFDEMVARLESSFNSQRRFIADAAHELRTPLAIIRTGAEVHLAKRQPTPQQWASMAQRVVIASSRAERILNGLLALARTDSGGHRARAARPRRRSRRRAQRGRPRDRARRADHHQRPAAGTGHRRPRAAGPAGRQPHRQRRAP
jgi:signal transduction histidine kinase